MELDPRSFGKCSPGIIYDDIIAHVDSCRYLGIHMDYKLVCNVYVGDVCFRLQQSLNLLRQVTTFGVNWEIQLLFSHAVVDSILCYDISVWFGNLTVELQSKISLSTESHENRGSLSIS